ncbi:MAG: SHOCT domain-containing protein [Micromonosporaceae bacterium]
MTMMYGHWFGGGWWMVMMPVLWIVLIGVIAWAVIRFAVDRDQSRRESASEILARRFAAGEIDAPAYSDAPARLAGPPPRSS